MFFNIFQRYHLIFKNRIRTLIIQQKTNNLNINSLYFEIKKHLFLDAIFYKPKSFKTFPLDSLYNI